MTFSPPEVSTKQNKPSTFYPHSVKSFYDALSFVEIFTTSYLSRQITISESNTVQIGTTGGFAEHAPKILLNAEIRSLSARAKNDTIRYCNTNTGLFSSSLLKSVLRHNAEQPEINDASDVTKRKYAPIVFDLRFRER